MEAARWKRRRFVSVVGDDVGSLTATVNCLRSHGLATRSFCNAEQLLGSKDGLRGSCLVLDARLPGMSGLQLQRELRARGLAIPVIFATSDADAALGKELIRAGARAVLRKPIDPERLARHVRAALAM